MTAGVEEPGTGRIARQVAADLDAVMGWGDDVRAFCATHGIGEQAAFHLALIFEEVLSNVVLHGGGADRWIEASLELADGTLRGEVSDDGPAFDPLQMPPPALDAGLADRPIGGLGVHMLRTFTDGVLYQRRDGCNRLSFVKRLPPQ